MIPGVPASVITGVNKQGGEHHVSPGLCTAPLSFCEHMFSISVWSVGETCDTGGRAGRRGRRMCGDELPDTVYSGQQRLWTPACGRGPTCNHSPRPARSIRPNVHNFSQETNNEHAGRVDSSWGSGSSVLEPSSRRGTQNRPTVHHRSVKEASLIPHN